MYLCIPGCKHSNMIRKHWEMIGCTGGTIRSYGGDERVCSCAYSNSNDQRQRHDPVLQRHIVIVQTPHDILSSCDRAGAAMCHALCNWLCIYCTSCSNACERYPLSHCLSLLRVAQSAADAEQEHCSRYLHHIGPDCTKC